AVSRLGAIRRRDFATGTTLVAEMELAALRGLRVTRLFLHPQVTEVALAGGVSAAFTALADRAERLGIEAGIVTHNPLRAAAVLGRELGRFAAVVAPCNPKGYKMFPDREACEQLYRREPGRFIAAEVSAGDAVAPGPALAHVRALGLAGAVLDRHVDGIAAAGERRPVDELRGHRLLLPLREGDRRDDFRHLEALRDEDRHGGGARDPGEVLQAYAHRARRRQGTGLDLGNGHLWQWRPADQDGIHLQGLERVLVGVGVVDRQPKRPAAGLGVAHRKAERLVERLVRAEGRPRLAARFPVAEVERRRDGLCRLVALVADLDPERERAAAHLHRRGERDADVRRRGRPGG